MSGVATIPVEDRPWTDKGSIRALACGSPNAVVSPYTLLRLRAKLGIRLSSFCKLNCERVPKSSKRVGKQILKHDGKATLNGSGNSLIRGLTSSEASTKKN